MLTDLSLLQTPTSWAQGGWRRQEARANPLPSCVIRNSDGSCHRGPSPTKASGSGHQSPRREPWRSALVRGCGGGRHTKPNSCFTSPQEARPRHTWAHPRAKAHHGATHPFPALAAGGGGGGNTILAEGPADTPGLQGTPGRAGAGGISATFVSCHTQETEKDLPWVTTQRPCGAESCPTLRAGQGTFAARPKASPLSSMGHSRHAGSPGSPQLHTGGTQDLPSLLDQLGKQQALARTAFPSPLAQCSGLQGGGKASSMAPDTPGAAFTETKAGQPRPPPLSRTRWPSAFTSQANTPRP